MKSTILKGAWLPFNTHSVISSNEDHLFIVNSRYWQLIVVTWAGEEVARLTLPKVSWTLFPDVEKLADVDDVWCCHDNNIYVQVRRRNSKDRQLINYKVILKKSTKKKQFPKAI